MMRERQPFELLSWSPGETVATQRRYLHIRDLPAGPSAQVMLAYLVHPTPPVLGDIHVINILPPVEGPSISTRILDVLQAPPSWLSQLIQCMEAREDCFVTVSDLLDYAAGFLQMKPLRSVSEAVDNADAAKQIPWHTIAAEISADLARYPSVYGRILAEAGARSFQVLQFYASDLSEYVDTRFRRDVLTTYLNARLVRHAQSGDQAQ